MLELAKNYTNFSLLRQVSVPSLRTILTQYSFSPVCSR